MQGGSQHYHSLPARLFLSSEISMSCDDENRGLFCAEFRVGVLVRFPAKFGPHSTTASVWGLRTTCLVTDFGHRCVNVCLTGYLAIAHVVARRKRRAAQATQRASSPPQHKRRNLCRLSRCLVSSLRIRGSSPQQPRLAIRHAALGQGEKIPPPQFLRCIKKAHV